MTDSCGATRSAVRQGEVVDVLCGKPACGQYLLRDWPFRYAPPRALCEAHLAFATDIGWRPEPISVDNTEPER